ncbi:hypothetical protein I546_4117 [Mycobacterium kansasii 732]|nr:hypothetical protein I546_4117 [Mycobacterium kansasii 732]
MKAQLERQLDAANAQYPPTKEATRADIPYWTQPAPQQPKQGPPKRERARRLSTKSHYKLTSAKSNASIIMQKILV